MIQIPEFIRLKTSSLSRKDSGASSPVVKTFHSPPDSPHMDVVVPQRPPTPKKNLGSIMREIILPRHSPVKVPRNASNLRRKRITEDLPRTHDLDFPHPRSRSGTLLSRKKVTVGQVSKT